MLARAVGPQVEKDIKALLDQMFSVGLSYDLTSALKVIAQEVPQLQRDIQGELMRWVVNKGILCMCTCALFKLDSNLAMGGVSIYSHNPKALPAPGTYTTLTKFSTI